MIDLLLGMVLLVGMGFWICRRNSGPRLWLWWLSGAAVFHALCLLSLYLLPPNYEYVIAPSQANEAGLREAGVVREIDGRSVGSVGEFLGIAFSKKEPKILAEKEFQRTAPSGGGWKFWWALDSYALEEAGGGLVFFPRRPVLKTLLQGFNVQLPLSVTGAMRFLMANGEKTPTIGSFLRQLKPMPWGGVIPLHFMQPSMDSGVGVAYFSPVLFGEVPQGMAHRVDEMAQLRLGFSGLPLLLVFPRADHQLKIVHAMGMAKIFGPAGLEEEFSADPGGWRSLAGEGEVYALPRLALLPWIGPNFVVSWLLGVPGTLIRQLFSVLTLPSLIAVWPGLPRQYYLLDDGITHSTLFFKVSSLCASFAISLLLWIGLQRAFHFFRSRTSLRSVFLFSMVMALQLAELFVIRRF